MRKAPVTRGLVRATGVGLLCFVFSALPVTAQEHEADEHATETEAASAAHEAHSEEGEHHGHEYHRNVIGLFFGATDEEGHDPELTLGFEYERRLSQRWGIGGILEYSDGLRNSIFVVPVYWHPRGRWIVIAAPGVEHHFGRGLVATPHKSEGNGETRATVDEDETYFLFRLGVAYEFSVAGAWGIAPHLDLDFVEGERVLVYGLSLTYGF